MTIGVSVGIGSPGLAVYSHRTASMKLIRANTTFYHAAARNITNRTKLYANANIATSFLIPATLYQCITSIVIVVLRRRKFVSIYQR